MRRNAFTLIELLVVISIIALLVAMLLPALSQAKVVAHSTICQSNLRQIVIGVFSYAEDNNNFAPPWDTPTGNILWSNPTEMFGKDYLGGSAAVLQDPSVGPPYDFNDSWVQTCGRNWSPSTNQVYDWLRWPDATGGEFNNPGGGYFSYALSEEYSSIASDLLNGDARVYPPAPLDRHAWDVNLLDVPYRNMVGSSPSTSHMVWDSREGPGGWLLSMSSDTFAPEQELKAPRHIDGTVANVGYVDGHVAGFHNLVFSGYPPTIPH